jgi:hypothetical protein
MLNLEVMYLWTPLDTPHTSIPFGVPFEILLSWKKSYFGLEEDRSVKFWFNVFKKDNYSVACDIIFDRLLLKLRTLMPI